MKFQMKTFQRRCLAVSLMVVAPLSCFSEDGFMVKEGGTIAFLGDSITQAGAGPDGYIALFKLACDVTGHKVNVINAGISGHKSNDMLARLQRDVIDPKPDWVSISCGVNDVWHGERGVPLPDYKRNMAEIVDRCQKAGIKVLLLTATPIYEDPNSNENQKLAAYNEYLRELAKEKKVLLCDLNKAFLSVYKNKTVKENVLTTDGVHMNPRGNGLMAREIFRSLGANEDELKKAEQRWGAKRRPAVVGENLLKLSEVHWDFERGDLQGWKQSGNLAKQPSSRSDDRHSGNFNKQGKYFIGTCELETPGTAYNDDLTGELQSSPFVIDRPALSFLVGGGSNPNLRFALYDAETGKELMVARGRDAEAMRRVLWDLGEFQRRRVYLKIVDGAKGGWGHINVDDIHPLTADEIDAMRRAEEEKKEAAKRKTANLLEGVFKAERKVYSGKELSALGMPLGPIGGGSIYLRGTGELYRWEIFNNMNSAAYIPDQFFAIRAKMDGGEAVTRVLRYDDGKEPGVKDILFVGEFPLAYLDYVDPALPVKVSMIAFSPFIPTNAKDSALPMIFFSFTVANESNKSVNVSLVGTLQNAVGYDGKARYKGVSWEGYGANVNSLFPGGQNEYLVFMTGEGASGNMGLAMGGEGAAANAQWADAKSFLEEFSRTGSVGIAAEGPSEKGKTWNAALASAFEVMPGEKKEVGFALLWYFPGRLGVGNMYENWCDSALDLAMYLTDADRLVRRTVLFHDTLFDTTLPYYVVERLSSQMSTPCTQLCMWLKDNSFFGWEGLHGDGTGCCPMNCNHVWNYEQTLARLFPEIEKRMRVIDLEHQMEDNGAVHHRVAFPLQGRVTGPGAVCDGQASTVSKTYREHLLSSDNAFLERMWPKAKKAMEFMISYWDGPDEDGVMRGKQFNTYDTHISGPNTFTGSQYLAALRAAEEMAKEMGDEAAAKRYRSIFDKGSKWLSENLFDGEYFVQEWPQKNPDYDYGLGCHADQLMGQWWANQSSLGYVLPKEQVKSALHSMFKYDFIPDFSVFDYSLGHRVFVWDDGAGLICCTWPKGGKPRTVILYAEEVWTGIEYEVAALMIQEGLINEALAIIRTVHDRYTTGPRSPWNEIECGDHYARAMSSWSVLLAAQAFHYHGPKGILGFDPKLQRDNFKSFFSTAEGWGSFSQKREGNTQTNLIELKYGSLNLKQLEVGVPSSDLKGVRVELNGTDLPFKRELVKDNLVMVFSNPVTLKETDSVEVVASW